VEDSPDDYTDSDDQKDEDFTADNDADPPRKSGKLSTKGKRRPRRKAGFAPFPTQPSQKSAGRDTAKGGKATQAPSNASQKPAARDTAKGSEVAKAPPKAKPKATKKTKAPKKRLAPASAGMAGKKGRKPPPAPSAGEKARKGGKRNKQRPDAGKQAPPPQETVRQRICFGHNWGEWLCLFATSPHGDLLPAACCSRLVHWRLLGCLYLTDSACALFCGDSTCMPIFEQSCQL